MPDLIKRLRTLEAAMVKPAQAKWVRIVGHERDSQEEWLERESVARASHAVPVMVIRRVLVEARHAA